MPSAGAVYRCHVCRLELIMDPETQKMTVAPFEQPDDASAAKPVKRKRF